MLDVIYYPAAVLLWVGHAVTGAVLGGGSGAAWLGAIAFVAVVVRLAQFPLDWVIDSRAGRERVRLPWLPLIARVAVSVWGFLTVHHVLRSFDRTGHGWGQLGMSPQENAHTPNLVFDVGTVQSFLSARVFGAPLSVSINTPQAQLSAFADFGEVSAGAAVVPVIALTAITVVLLAVNGWNSPLAVFADSGDTGARVLLPLVRFGLPALLVLASLTVPIGSLGYLVATAGTTAAIRKGIEPARRAPKSASAVPGQDHLHYRGQPNPAIGDPRWNR